MIRLALLALLAATPAISTPALADTVPGGIEALNDFRADQGLDPVTANAQLEQAAETHAADLARTGRFSHEGSDGSSVGDRAREAGYRWCFIAENIAKGQRSLPEVMTGWKNSEGHRRNMVAERATEAALIRGDQDIWVMVLGTPGC